MTTWPLSGTDKGPCDLAEHEPTRYRFLDVLDLSLLRAYGPGPYGRNGMRVFISWSGAEAREIAAALRDWLPDVVQAVKPWMSSEDIEKGERWSRRIGNELDENSQGIVVVTKASVTAPWLNFEAGALAKSVEDARVRTFLRGLSPTDFAGPLSEFQATVASDEEDVYKMVRSINEQLEDPLADDRLRSAFDRTWPEFLESLNAIVVETPDKEVERSDRDLLEEMLGRVRAIERLQQRSSSFTVKPHEARSRWKPLVESVRLVDEQGREVKLSGDDFSLSTTLPNWPAEATQVEIRKASGPSPEPDAADGPPEDENV